MALYDEPGVQDATVLDFLLPFLASGGASALQKVPEGLEGAQAVIKGLGNAGELTLGPSGAPMRGISATARGLMTPGELSETMVPLGRALSGPDLVNELAEKIALTPAKGEITLSDGSKWLLHGIQKGFGKNPDNPLLEYLSGPKPAYMTGQTTTTSLSAMKEALGG